VDTTPPRPYAPSPSSDATVGNSNILPNQIPAHCTNNVILPPDTVVNIEVKQEQISGIKPGYRTRNYRFLKIYHRTVNGLQRNNAQHFDTILVLLCATNSPRFC
jgi:hypothetical protein